MLRKEDFRRAFGQLAALLKSSLQLPLLGLPLTTQYILHIEGHPQTRPTYTLLRIPHSGTIYPRLGTSQIHPKPYTLNPNTKNPKIPTSKLWAARRAAPPRWLESSRHVGWSLSRISLGIQVYKSRWILKILHDPGPLKPWELWHSKFRSCRILNINNIT